MVNLKDILKTIVVDEKSRNTLTSLKEISGLFEICKQYGYNKEFNEFESEFERLSKESGLSELSNEQLFDIAGGAGFDLKRVSSVALTALTLGGAIPQGTFAKENDINISVPAVTFDSQNVKVEETNKEEDIKDKFNKVKAKVLEFKDSAMQKGKELKDSAVQKGKELTEKGIKFVKERPGTSAAIAATVVGVPTFIGLAKNFKSKLLESDEKIIDEVKKMPEYAMGEFDRAIAFLLSGNYKEVDYTQRRANWNETNLLGHEVQELIARYSTISGSSILKGLIRDIKFMDSEKFSDLCGKTNNLSSREKEELGNLFYCWQTLLVRARALAIEEENHNLLPLLAEEMLKISNNYLKYNIVDNKEKLPKLAKELIDTSDKELKLYGKLIDLGENGMYNMLTIAKAATQGIDALEEIQSQLDLDNKQATETLTQGSVEGLTKSLTEGLAKSSTQTLNNEFNKLSLEAKRQTLKDIFNSIGESYEKLNSYHNNILMGPNINYSDFILIDNLSKAENLDNDKVRVKMYGYQRLSFGGRVYDYDVSKRTALFIKNFALALNIFGFEALKSGSNLFNILEEIKFECIMLETKDGCCVNLKALEQWIEHNAHAKNMITEFCKLMAPKNNN